MTDYLRVQSMEARLSSTTKENAAVDVVSIYERHLPTESLEGDISMSHTAYVTPIPPNHKLSPTPLRVLVACEFSGIVRSAFEALGCDAWSCDLLPTEQPGNHYQGDVRDLIGDHWDVMIAHPPCTYLSNAGNRWLNQPGRSEKRDDALDFFRLLMNAPIPMIAIENPIGSTWKYIRKPDQIIQPFQFGDPVTKRTCLWLKNLPPLMATFICHDPFVNWTKYKKGAHSGKSRAKFWPGIAQAMAQQWASFASAVPTEARS